MGRRLLQFLGTMLGFAVLAWMAGLAVWAATSRHRDISDLLRRFLNNVARRLVLLSGLIAALSMLGVSLGALLVFVGGGCLHHWLRPPGYAGQFRRWHDAAPVSSV